MLGTCSKVVNNQALNNCSPPIPAPFNMTPCAYKQGNNNCPPTVYVNNNTLSNGDTVCCD
jgi:hypothetical protein